MLAPREGAVDCCLFRSREGGGVGRLTSEDGPDVRRGIARTYFVPSPSPSIRVGHSGDMGGVATPFRSGGAISDCDRS